MARELVSDAVYQAQEELMFRTAARLRGAVFYRALLLLLLPVLAWLSVGKISFPLLFWSVLAVGLVFDGMDVLRTYTGKAWMIGAVWYLAADALIHGVLAATSGGLTSPFSALFFLMPVYAATWFQRSLAWISGAFGAVCLLILSFRGPTPVEGTQALLVPILVLGGLSLAAGEVADLVLVTRQRIVRAAMDLIQANKRVIEQQDRLQESEERLRLVLDTASEGIFGVGLDGSCTFANRSCVAMLGYSSEAELLGRNMHALVHHSHPDGTPYPTSECAVSRATRRGESAHSDEDLHWRADGSSFPVEYWSHPIQREGRVVGAVVTVIDITQRKHAEEELKRLNIELEERVAQRTEELATSNSRLREALDTLQVAQNELVRSEKLASLGELVAGVAHELNTPLGNSVVVASTLADHTYSFAEEAKSGQLRRSTLVDYVSKAEQAVELLTRNLNTASELISRFKQVAVDQASAQRRSFDLAVVVEEVLATLRPQFKKTPHSLESVVPSGIVLDSFPGPLGQVITNLVNNARIHAFDPAVRGVVRISAEAKADRVHLEVYDNGRGVAVGHQARIFDPFFTTRLGQGGSGLGLYIVYGIVKRVLGGQIDVSSAPGVGTTFHLDLPLTAPAGSGEGQWAGATAVAGKEAR